SSAWARYGNRARHTAAARHAGMTGIRETEFIRFSGTTVQVPPDRRQVAEWKEVDRQENAGGPRGGCAGQRTLAGRVVARGGWTDRRAHRGSSTSSTASHGSSREAMVQ